MRFIISLHIILTSLCLLWGTSAYAGFNLWTASNLSASSTVLQNQPDDINQLYAGTQADGLYQRDLSGTNSIWEPMDSATNFNPIPGFSDLLINPDNPDNLWAASFEQGLFSGTPSTQIWDKIPELANDTVIDLLADVRNGNTRLYAVLANSGIFSSLDGQNWRDINSNLRNTPINHLASSSRAVFAATYEGIFKTEDAGATWQTSSHILAYRNIQDLSNSLNVPDVIYAAAPDYGMFVTNDAGATWQTINNGLNEFSVQHIQVHPQNSNIVLVSSDKNIYLSQDGGQQWIRKTNGLENIVINDLLLENRRELRAHAATEQGIFDIDFDIVIESMIVNHAPINSIPAQLPELIINNSFSFSSLPERIQVSDIEAGLENILVKLSTDNGRLEYNQNIGLAIEINSSNNSLILVGSQQSINIILSTLSLIPDRLGSGTLSIQTNDLGNGSLLEAAQTDSSITFNVIAENALQFNEINNTFRVGINSFFELLFDNIAYLTDGNDEAISFSLDNAPENIRIDPLNGDIFGEFNQVGTQSFVLVIRQGTQILRQTLNFTVSEQADYDVLQIVGEELPNPLIIPVDTLFEFVLPTSGGDGSPIFFSLDNIPDGLNFDGQEGILNWTPDTTGLFNLSILINQNGEESRYPLNIFVSDNHVPELAFIDTKILMPNVPFNFTAQGTDIDGDELRYRLEDAPLGALIDPNSGISSWTPTDTGQFLITVILEEQVSREDSNRPLWDVEQQVLLDVVLEGNAPPAFEPIGTLRLQPSVPFSIAIRANDPNNDPLVYELENPQLGMSLEPATGVFSWPNPVIGTYIISVEVSESEHQGDEAREYESLEDEMYIILRVGNDIDSVGQPSWQALSTGLTDQSLQQLQISPSNNNVIYVGSAAGVYKTTDGGQTWNSSNQGMGTSRIKHLQINPKNTQIIYAENTKGIFRSTNAGSSWQRLSNGVGELDISSFSLDLENPSTLYLGTRDGQVLLSENDGDSFISINAEAKLPSAITSLLVDRHEFDILYAGTESHGIFKSFERGIAWQNYGSGLEQNQSIDSLNGHPDNMDIIYATTPNGLKASYNSGFTWTNLNAGLETLNINTIISDPNHVDIIYIGTNKGTYRSLDAGQEWHRFGDNIEDKNITAFAFNQSTPPSLYAASENSGVYLLPDSDILPQEKDELEDLGIDGDELFNLDDATLDTLPLTAFAVLNAEEVAELPIDVMDKFNALRLGKLNKEAISGLSLQQFQNLPDIALAGFNRNNIGGLAVEIIENLSSNHLNLLIAADIQQTNPEDLTYFLSNLNPNLINPADVQPFLPTGWQIDLNSGDLIVPEDTLLRFNTFANQTGISDNIILPELPDLNQTFGLGGQGDGARLLDEFNQSLDNNEQLANLNFAQNEEGIIELSSQFSFIPDRNTMRQAPANAAPGFTPATDGSGRFILTTPTRKQFILNPAPRKVSDALSVLQSFFQNSGITVRLRLKANGELLIEGNLPTNRRAGTTPSRVHRVAVFDSAIEPAPDGVTTGLTSNSEGNFLMVYPDGTAQKIYPAILNPQEFERIAKTITGIETVINNADGSATVTYAGNPYKIIPTFGTTSRTVGAGESFNTKLEVWIKEGVAGLRYSIQAQDQVITTRLLIQ